VSRCARTLGIHEVFILLNSEGKSKLSKRILRFHETNFEKPQTHQPILNPKSAYFQYSRLYGVLEEANHIDFKTFLDVGCAEGMFLLAAKSLRPSCEIYGIDFSRAAVRKAQGYTSKAESHLVRADALHLPFRNQLFDVVLCSETLEHVVDDLAATKELARVCGKLCLITVPSFNSQKAKLRFNPDIDCKHDSHLRKYLKSELEYTLAKNFRNIRVFNLSLWHLSTAAIILHNFLPKYIASKISKFFSVFAGFDYRLCKSGAHGHSFICICLK